MVDFSVILMFVATIYCICIQSKALTTSPRERMNKPTGSKRHEHEQADDNALQTGRQKLLNR